MSYKILHESPDAETLAQWQEFLANAEYATHYVTPNFFVDPFIRGGKRFAVLTFDEDDKVSAVLTGVDDGKKLVSEMAVRPQTAFRKDTNLFQTAQILLHALKEKGGERAKRRYKMDLTKLKIHNLKENMFDFGIKTYQSLPLSVKTKIKQIAGKN